MLINLSDVLESEGRQITREAVLEMTCFGNGQGNFEITEKSPVSFTFSNEGKGKAKVEGGVRITFRQNLYWNLTDLSLHRELRMRKLTTWDLWRGIS